MKNLHLLPTDKPSRLLYFGTSKELTLQVNTATFRVFERSTQNIYITSDEKPKAGDWSLYQNKIHKCIEDIIGDEFKKIILTTDQDLIKDGVQDIDDEFLEWFIKNPSCEEGEVDKNWNYPLDKRWKYKIIIPKEEQKQHLIDIMRGDEELGLYEEPKQETLEEAFKKWSGRTQIGYDKIDVLNFGAKWQAERMYSEEDMIAFMQFIVSQESLGNTSSVSITTAKYYLEQFKKK